MTRKNPPLKWPLPIVTNPDDSRCYTIPVPNDIHHIGAFLGAIFLLSKPYAWADDPDHTALAAAAVWRDIFDNLEQCMTDDWRVRLNPDDCTIIQQFDDDIGIFIDVIDLSCAVDTIFQEEFPPTNPPGSGQPGEQPGGGDPEPGACFDLNLTIHSNARTMIPLPIGDGWTITIDNVVGAWNDGYAPFIGEWYCYQGFQFILGTCQSGYHRDAETTDPLLTAYHMQLVMQIPGGTYTTLESGTPYTVPTSTPAGITWLQANDGTLTDNSGDITLHLQACNGASHLYDFRLSDYGFAPDNTIVTMTPEPHWVSGDGWVSDSHQTTQPDSVFYDFIFKTFSETFHVTKLVMTFSLTTTSPSASSDQVGVGDYSDNTRANVNNPPGGVNTLAYQPAGGIDTDRLYGIVTWAQTGNGHTVTLQILSLEVFYQGTPPTW